VSWELANADAFVLPSHNEGLPMSLLEAMAATLPVISTPVGGIPEVVEHGVNGLITDAGNVQSLANNMRALVDDAELRAKLGRAARETIQSRYSAEAVLPRLERLYQQLL
jgi:glycosyltransferase involved in cell wall biosynthesis